MKPSPSSKVQLSRSAARHDGGLNFLPGAGPPITINAHGVSPFLIVHEMLRPALRYPQPDRPRPWKRARLAGRFPPSTRASRSRAFSRTQLPRTSFAAELSAGKVSFHPLHEMARLPCGHAHHAQRPVVSMAGIIGEIAMRYGPSGSDAHQHDSRTTAGRSTSRSIERFCNSFSYLSRCFVGISGYRSRIGWILDAGASDPERSSAPCPCC